MDEAHCRTHDDSRRPIAVGQRSDSGDLEIFLLIVHALKMHNIALLILKQRPSFFQLNLLHHSSLIVTTFCKDRDPTCKLTMDVETIKIVFPNCFSLFPILIIPEFKRTYV